MIRSTFVTEIKVKMYTNNKIFDMLMMSLLMLLVSMCGLVADNLLKYSSNDILCIELFLKSGFKKIRIVVLFKFNWTKRKFFF